MPETCPLREHASGQFVHCDGEQCVFWRVLEHIDIEGPRTGCAIQHFSLVDGGKGIASWLLSVKRRLESGVPAENPLDSLLPGATCETPTDSANA